LLELLFGSWWKSIGEMGDFTTSPLGKPWENDGTW